MASIEEMLDDLKSEFDELEDGFERYSYLIELASLLPPFPEEKRTDDNLVRGCQSHVWLNFHVRNGLFYFDADSDTLIIKGVLLLLQDLFCEQSPEQVANAEVDLLPALGLGTAFSDERQKGIGFILASIQNAGRKYWLDEKG